MVFLLRPVAFQHLQKLLRRNILCRDLEVQKIPRHRYSHGYAHPPANVHSAEPSGTLHLTETEQRFHSLIQNRIHLFFFLSAAQFPALSVHIGKPLSCQKQNLVLLLGIPEKNVLPGLLENRKLPVSVSRLDPARHIMLFRIQIEGKFCSWRQIGGDFLSPLLPDVDHVLQLGKNVIIELRQPVPAHLKAHRTVIAELRECPDLSRKFLLHPAQCRLSDIIEGSAALIELRHPAVHLYAMESKPVAEPVLPDRHCDPRILLHGKKLPFLLLFGIPVFIFYAPAAHQPVKFIQSPAKERKLPSLCRCPARIDVCLGQPSGEILLLLDNLTDERNPAPTLFRKILKPVVDLCRRPICTAARLPHVLAELKQILHDKQLFFSHLKRSCQFTVLFT